MPHTTTKNSFLLAVGILIPLATAATCDVNVAWTNHYDVRASGVGDIPGICGGLWDNNKRFGDCASATETYCNGKDGELIWQMTTTTSCDKGKIESTW